MNEITIEAKQENMDAVQDFVRANLKRRKPKVQNQIAVVVDEIFSNIANYAYGDGTGYATVRVSAVAVGEIFLEFVDSGAPYNPLEKEDPDITLSAEERGIGGLGIFMVKKMMDSVEYRREDGKNILTMRRSNWKRV
jgi:anti-sigma regulatory factor (Ser/Thr protein kinase)